MAFRTITTRTAGSLNKTSSCHKGVVMAYKYQPISKNSRQETPDPLPRQKANSYRRSIRWPLIRNDELLSAPGEICGHPRIDLTITTHVTGRGTLSAIEEGDNLQPVIQTKTFVSFFVQDNTERPGEPRERRLNPCREFEEQQRQRIEEMPDIQRLRDAYNTAQRKLEAAEKKNHDFLTQTIPEYAEANEKKKAAEQDLERCNRGDGLYWPKKNAVRSSEDAMYKLRERNRAKLPNDTKELRGTVTEAWRALETARNNKWQRLHEELFTYFRSKDVQLQKDSKEHRRLISDIARALGDKGKSCAIYTLEADEIFVSTNKSGIVQDVSGDPIDVSLETIMAALEPTRANTIVEHGQSFASVPLCRAGTDDILYNIQECIGSGVVGLRHKKQMVVLVLPKWLILLIIMSEQHLRKMGIPQALLETFKRSAAAEQSVRALWEERRQAAEQDADAKKPVASAESDDSQPDEKVEAEPLEETDAPEEEKNANAEGTSDVVEEPAAGFNDNAPAPEAPI